MKKITFIFIIVICATVLSQAQFQYHYPNKEDQAVAKQLKSKYSDDDYVCAMESTERYTFDIGKQEAGEQPPVTAKKEEENELIALTDNFGYTFVESYHAFTSLYRFRVWYKDGKSYKQSDMYNDHSVSDNDYSSNGIFYADEHYKSFKYPFTTLGDMMKFSFIKDYTDVKYLSRVFFNDENPIEEKTITFEIPDWLTVDFKEINFEGFDISKTKNYNAGKKFTTYTFTMQHCASMKRDDNAPLNASNWPHVILVAKEYTYKGAKYKAFNSTDDLYAWNNKLVNKVKNNETDLKPIVTKLTAGKTNDMDKIKSIYYWVQDNIRYIAFEQGLAAFQPMTADKVFKNKYGDCKGMANLLTTMLKMSGYDARLTWIGTKDIPYDHSIPSLCVDNHMICALVLKDSLYFLDGTETYISLGDYADRIQGRQALIQNGKSYMLKNVPSFDKEHNKVFCKRTLQLNNEVLKGTTDMTYIGESKTGILRAYNEMESSSKEDALNRFLTKNDKNYTVTDIKTSDLKDREQPLNFKYNFEVNNKVTTADKEVYVTLELDHPYNGITVKEDRKQDYVFREKVYNVCETEFTVPNGYTVKYIPDPVNETHPDFSLTSEYKTQKSKTGATKIIYKRTLSFDNGLIKKSEMKDFYGFVKKMKDTYSDQVILETTSSSAAPKTTKAKKQ